MDLLLPQNGLIEGSLGLLVKTVQVYIEEVGFKRFKAFLLWARFPAKIKAKITKILFIFTL